MYRLDTDYHHPTFAAYRRRIDSAGESARLGDLVSAPLVPGFAAGKGDQVADGEGGVLQLRPTNIIPDEGLSFDDVKYVPNEDVSPSDFLSPGEVLFNNTNSSAWVGKSAHFDGRDDGQVVCSNHITRIRLNERVSPSFIAATLNMMQRAGYFGRLATNFNSQAGINATTLADVVIPLGEAEVRNRILATLDSARNLRKKMLADADSVLSGLDGFVLDQLGLTLPPPDQSSVHAVRLVDVQGGRFDALYYAPRYRGAVARLHANPLPKKSLGRLSPDLAGGATPRRGSQELYTNEGIRFLRIMNVAPFEIGVEDVKYITSEVHEGDLTRSQLREKDILMTITGRVGTTAVVTPEVLPANINQHIVRIRLIDDTVLPEYLAAYLNCSFGLTLTNRGVTGGTRIAVDYGTVRNLQIPIPHPKVQSKIADEVANRRNKARRLRAEADVIWNQAKADFEAALLGPVRPETGKGKR